MVGSLFEGGLLICTDVAARGIDIPHVKNVVNYQMPVNAETYVHRCGRTARIGREGFSFSLLSPEDDKNFRVIKMKVLKKEKLDDDDVTKGIDQMEIDQGLLSKYTGLINSAKKIERSLF